MKEITEKTKSFLQKKWHLLIIWSCALTLRVLIACLSRGYIHPDEQFQAIEIAFEQINGYGYIPWEFIDGARSWLYPGIVLLIFKAMIFLGVTQTETIIIAVRLFSAICSMITVITSYFFGRLLFNEKVGLLATVFVSFWSDFLFWSARTLSDSIAMNFSFVASYFVFKLMVNPSPGKKLAQTSKDKSREIKIAAFDGSLAGLLFGLAFMFKFPTLILAGPLVLCLLINKNWRGVIYFSLFLIIMIIGQGLLDLFTWGSFLHSPRVFFQYNILSGKSANHGVSPFLSYPILMFDANGEFFLLLILFFFLGLRREKKAVYLLITIGLYFLVFSCIGHKEYRFMLPIMPPFALFAAKGFLRYPQFIRKKHLRKGLYVFFTLLMIGFSTANSCYVYSLQPNKQLCEAFQYVGEQKNSKVLLAAIPSPFNGPGFSYLNKNISVYYQKGEFLTSYLIYFQRNTTYIIIPEEEYFRNVKIYQEIIDTQNLTLVKFFKGTHPRFDKGVYLFVN